MTAGADNRLLEWALKYARRGWPVFPCERRGKKPLTEHGLKDASASEETIRTWWAHWPDANIGHPTGEQDVLDVDGPTGEGALAELEAKHGKLPSTLTAKTGKGHHLYFTANGTPLRNSTGKLGPGLDVRGNGGYVILPPSVHPSGARYEWTGKEQVAPLPAWVAALLSESERPQASESSAGEQIPEGQRHAHLLRLAGKLRAAGCDERTITAALLAENASRCDPPKSENEVCALAHDVALRYKVAAKAGTVSPWSAVEGLDTFLESGEGGADFLDSEKRILARAAITEIFSPRGFGKSLYALWLAVQLALRGLRVLYVDRDNPRHVVRERLRGFGATGQLAKLKVISREKCPPLTNAGAWALFPYAEYDVVILDSFDSAAEGVGEQDSGKPSRAIAPLLDIARRENGPAVMILGNTVRTARHSRGSGVIEDRADIVYEVRDATGFHFTGASWFEELPIVGAEGWAGRAARRKQRETFRLAFVASKFRIGPEPEPFVLEIDLTSDPWTVRDVTDDVDAEGAAAREQKAQEKAETLQKAVDVLVCEISRRSEAGESAILKKQAETFLTAQHFTQNVAREAIKSQAFEVAEIDGKGHPKALRLAVKNGESNRNTATTGAAQTAGRKDADFGCPVSMRPTEIDPSQTGKNGGSKDCGISVEPSLFSPRENEQPEPRIPFADDSEAL